MIKVTPRRFRFVANWWPALRGTGVRIRRISEDWLEWDLELRLNWRTRNYVGTIFGGSLYAAADPWYMLAFIHALGPDYVVWDKAADIRFRKPGRGRLYATIRIPASELDDIRAALETERSIDRDYQIDWRDKDGVIHATIGKTLYFRKKH